MEGILYKRGKHFSSWNERYFVLNRIKLAYYLKAGDRQSRGVLLLKPGCKVGEVDVVKRKTHKQMYCFVISWPQGRKGTSHHPNNEYIIQLGCDTKEIAETWKMAIENAIILSASILHDDLEPPPITDSDHVSTSFSFSSSLPTPVILLSAMERSLAMFSGSWEVASICGGIQVWCEKIEKQVISKSWWTMNASGLFFVVSSAVLFIAIALVGGRFVNLLVVVFLLSFSIMVYATTCASNKGVLPSFKASMVIRNSPTEVFAAVMDIENCSRWNRAIHSANLVQTIDQHSDIIHIKLKPVWIWPIWLPPRDLCLMRYWRQEEDGSFLICFQSAIHPECRPKQPYVRATCNGGGYTITPRLGSWAISEEVNSLVTHVVHMDPGGPETSLLVQFGMLLDYMQPWLLSLIGLRDTVEESKFVSINLSKGLVGKPDSVVRSSLPTQTLISTAVQVEEFHGNVPHMYWCEPEPGLMLVRGPDYAFDHRKVPSAPPAFKLLACDLFQTESAVENIARYPETVLQKRIALYKEHKEEMPFTFLLNFIIPGPPNMCLVVYFTTYDNVLKEDTPFAELFQTFLNGDDAFRDERFKLIPCIVEGNFVVRQAVGSTPAIIGKKLRQPYFRGENYFELDIDICSSSVANRVTGLVQGYTKKLIIDLGFLLQGNTPEELPERLFGSIRLMHIDLACAQPLRKLTTQ